MSDWKQAFNDAFASGSPGQSQGRWSKGDGDDDASFLSLFAPVDPFNRWRLLAPVVSLAGAAAVIVLTGVAAASLAVMTIALLAVVFLLTQVFGYEIVLPQMPR